jgi:hypothetical protein
MSIREATSAGQERRRKIKRLFKAKDFRTGNEVGLKTGHINL